MKRDRIGMVAPIYTIRSCGNAADNLLVFGAALNEYAKDAERIDYYSPNAHLGPLLERSDSRVRFIRTDGHTSGCRTTPPTRPLGRFLVPDPQRVAAYRARLPRGRLIGLTWKSHNPRKAERRIPLEAFAALADVSATFVCIQGSDAHGDAGALRALGLPAVTLPDFDPMASLDDLAALTDACDAVISTPQTGAYFAGALRKPTYVLVDRETLLQGAWQPWIRDNGRSYFKSTTVLERGGREWAPVIAALRSLLP